MIIGTEVFWWLMESSDVKAVGIKKCKNFNVTSWWKLYLLRRDDNQIFVMETRSLWWKPDLLDGNQIFVMKTRSAWMTTRSLWWKPDLRDENQIFVMKTRSLWWKVSVSRWWKLDLLSDQSLIFSVMIIPNSDPVGYLSRYSRSDRVQIHTK